VSSSQTDAIESLIKDRIEDWRRHLIDLSFRNRLINYRPTKSSTLPIQSPSINELLADPERREPFDFFVPLDPEEEGAASDSPAAPKVDEILTGLDEPKRLEKILSNLARRSNAEFEDKALRVLHLAVGFLEWEDVVRREQLRSPLILVPAELRRESPRDPYQLYLAADEEIVINPALTVKLEKDVGLDIPEDWAWEDKPIAHELDEIREAITETGWTVEESAVLGLFSFQKLVMYRDLQRNEEKVGGHALVRALASGGADSDFHEGFQGVPEAAELDSVQDPRESFSILDADASQRRCIEAAKQGKSFVMQGPPGTGKSQTIANIIAEALGQGKRVLFISEKIAALDVVHKRLASKGLSEFCLKMHGRDAARKEVVNSLHESLTGMARPRTAMSEREFDQLIDTRERLNAAVELLHRRSDVLLGMTPREVYAELAPLDGAPVLAEAVAASDRDGAEARRELNELLELFETLTHDWEAVTRADYLWRGYGATSFDEADRSRLLSRLEALQAAGRQLITIAEQVAQDVGLDWPVSAEAAQRLGRVGELLVRTPPLQTRWLRRDALLGLHDALAAARGTYHSLEETQRDFTTAYPHRQPPEFAADIDSRLAEALAGLSDAIGRSPAWEDELLARAPTLDAFASTAGDALDELEGHGRQLFDALGQPWRNPTLESIEGIKELADLAFQATDRPDRRWLVPAGLEKACSTLEQCQALFSAYQSGLAELRESYADEVLELDAESMLNRVAAADGKFMGKLGGAYRSDVKALRALKKNGKAPDNPAEDLREILRLDQLGAQIDAGRSEYEAAFGQWHNGREIDLDAIGRALTVAEAAQASVAADTDLEKLERHLCLGARSDTQLAQSAALVDADLRRIKSGLEHVEALAARPDLIAPTQQSLPPLRQRLAELRKPAASLLEVVRSLQEGRAGGSHSLSRLEEDARRVSSLRHAEAVTASKGSQWAETIGSPFRGGETDWEGLEAAFDWLEKLFELLDAELPPRLEEKLRTEERTWPDFDQLAAAVDAFGGAGGGLTEFFDAHRAAELQEVFEGSATSEVVELAMQMRSRLDELTAWTDFRRLGERIGGLGWGRFLDLLAAEPVAVDQVVPGFRKAYWNSRLDRLFEEVPDMKEFRGRSHEHLIENFSKLDKELVAAAADRIIAVCNGNRPAPVAVPGSEVGILKREAGKKKRHMPVRRLLQTLPSLLPDLKPCLMMSPLTVSHYLSPDHHFDLVVFDEASQVPPWDAINCIYRADQLIVVGDGKQLPPTPFFQQVDPEAEGFDEEAEREEEVMESILDACEALLPAESLRWHYRSRHEHLISFSNHHFYNNKLVTFPAPVLSAEDLGVHLIHVPDGVYDRARSRTNRVEARRVAERVVEHLRVRPERTVGVVAFSVAQAEAITDELDSLRSANPDLDQHFAGDRLDGVFVKNLESVQGDERDIVVFSVGYGYDEHRRFHQGFGPLNKEGGHRRLNVAVTRARQQVDVVTSVRCSDFDLAETAKPGAQRLRDYLEFAEQGPEALRSEIESMGGEYESPFEESVAEAVRNLGYQAIPQVGVGGFRIDLGVVDPDSPGRFALGIECDGATYHSTPTARDRDRLRQEILEGLNWRIHRIWSWDWVRERHKETERLREAIQHALDSDEEPVVDASTTTATDEDGTRDREVFEVHEIRGSEDAAELPWASRYERADLSRFRSEYQFHEPQCGAQLRGALKALVAVEAPISIDHTVKCLATSQGISRRGNRVIEAAKLVISDGIAKGIAERRGEFLWRPEQELEVVRVPDPDDDETKRSIEEIAPEELDLAIAKLREASGIGDGDTLLAQTARIFGFNRTGPAIREQLKGRLEALS
jgi:very-short-patch-repair endonuclease